MSTPTQPPAPPDPVQRTLRRLMFFFSLAYFAQGIAQAGALIDQPLSNWLMNSLHLNAQQAAERTAVLILPWTIKPLYGIISDFLPLAGYRRKTYLLLTSLLATLGFLWITGQVAGPESVSWVIMALLLTAFGTAFGDVLVDAVMVEKGKETGGTDAFQSAQWLWINAAGVLSALGGGLLAQHLPAAAAVKTAAGLVAAAPLMVGIVGWFLIPEAPSRIEVTRLRATAGSLIASLRSRELWAVLAFLALWKFSPSFGKPLFAYMSGTLHFSQEFIGYLGAVGSIGAVLGALVFPRLTRGQSERRVLAIAIALSALNTITYLLLRDQVSAMILAAATGFLEMMVQLAVLGLAARSCAKDAEGFSFAAIMSVLNLAGQGSALLGARLYVGVFHSQLAPLIVVSSLTTLLAYVLLPLVTRGERGAEV